MAITATNEKRIQELEKLSSKSWQDSIDSFDRCDTDGFLSQWASSSMSHQYKLEAQLVADGYMTEFFTLADMDGNLVPCKQLETRYGTSWAIFNSFKDAEGFDKPIIQWVGLGDRAVKNKGYKYVTVVTLGKVYGPKSFTSHAYIAPAIYVATPDNCRIVEVA